MLRNRKRSALRYSSEKGKEMQIKELCCVCETANIELNTHDWKSIISIKTSDKLDCNQFIQSNLKVVLQIAVAWDICLGLTVMKNNNSQGSTVSSELSCWIILLNNSVALEAEDVYCSLDSMIRVFI